ncbi:MAG: hypothetical protein DCC75_04655 [Proteobacteria bacterium]|nr:MAG: hypothetical protein DCC75_04655 [Pseudomonadota bacterium]
MAPLGSIFHRVLANIGVVAAITASAPTQVWALGEAVDLQLAGGKILALAEGDGFIFAATRGPRGVYITEDFGSNWEFADGGEYSEGGGKDIITTDSQIIAILGRTVYAAPLSSVSTSNNDYTPAWQEIDLDLDPGGSTFNKPEVPQALAADSSFLFVTTTYANVKVVQLSSLALQSTSQVLPVPAPVPLPRIALDDSADRLFVHLGASEKPAGRILRASFNSSSGAIGSWSEISPGAAGGACGAELRGGVGSAVNSGRYGGVFAAGDGIIYVTTFRGTDGGKGIYRSTDGGDCWRRVVTSGESDSSLDIRSAVFSGTTHIIGRYVSTNGTSNNSTVSFEEVPNDNIPFDAGLDSTALLIGSNASNCGAAGGDTCVMASSAFGAVATTDLGTGSSSSWGERLSGMRGLLVSDIDQSPTDPSIAILGLSGGIARSTNFDLSADRITASAVTYDRFVPLDGSTSLPEPVFAVKIDPTDANIVYVGNNRLLRAVFDSGGNPTWTVVNTVIAKGKVVRDIAVTSDKIYVVFGQVTGAIGGELRVFDRATLSPQLTDGLSGKPITSVAIADADGSEVVYVGVGGIKTLEDGGTSSSNLGLYRSTNGGTSFSLVEGNDALETSAVSSLAYDSSSDILYVAGNDTGLPDEFESGSGNDSDSTDDDATGTVYILKKASTNKITIKTPSKGFPSGSPVRSVAVDLKTQIGTVYAAVNNKLYQSNSKGDTWALLFEGLTDQSIRTLLFDDLVSASTSGLETISGNPNLIVSSFTSNIKSGTRKKISVTLSKEYQDTTSNRNKLKAIYSDIRTIVRKKNDLSLTIQPRSGYKWPSSGQKIKLRLKAGFISGDSEGLDSNDDEVIDGNAFKRVITVR